MCKTLKDVEIKSMVNISFFCGYPVVFKAFTGCLMMPIKNIYMTQQKRNPLSLPESDNEHKH